MNQPPPAAAPFAWGRCLLAAASGFLFTLLFFSVLAAWSEIRAQNWDGPRLGWLKIDFLARQLPWKQAAAGGALTLALALLAEGLRGVRAPLLRAPVALVRWGGRVFGRGAACAALLLLALLPRALAAATRPAAAPGAPNLLFVMVDTWRADHTSFLGYERDTFPGLGALAEKQALIFENAVSSAPWTKPSVATLFTALTPSSHGAMSHVSPELGRRFVAMGKEHLTLAEALRACGYDTAAWSANVNIQDMYGFAQGFGEYLYDPAATARDLAGLTWSWLEQRGAAARPFFAYVHVLDPHYPYAPPEPQRGTWDKSGSDYNLSYEEVKAFHEGRGQYSPEKRQRLVDAYDEELLGVDAALAPFLQRVLERHPNTVVLVVGDHGEEFWEHQRVGHGHVLFDELVHVPMLLWAPGLAPRRVSNQVPLLDVCPTLLDLCGVDAAAVERSAFQGSSLLPVLRGEESGHRPVPMETGGDLEPPWQLRGMRAEYNGRLWKMIRQEQDYRNPKESFALYDLTADPGERTNLAEQYPDVVEALFQLMKDRGWYVHPKDRIGDVMDVNVSPADAARLLELGYADLDEPEEQKPPGPVQE